MTLGRKTLFLQLFASIGSILLSVVVLRTIVFPSFVDIEHDLVDLNEKRVLAAITELDRFMLAMAGDYGGWTPTYKFVDNPTADYVEDNVSAPTLRNMNAHAIAIVDVNGQILSEYLLTDDSDKKLEFHDVVIDPDAVLAAVDASANDKVRKTGIVQTRFGPMTLAAHPILKNTLKGEPRGTFMLGTLITENYISKISERLSVDVRAIYRGSIEWQASRNLAEAESHDSHDHDIFSRRTLTDIFGEPIMVLEFRVPRYISSAGQRALLVALLFLAMSTLIILFVSFFSLKRMVISPLGGLTDYITRLRTGPGLSGKLDVSRRDELGVLATEFNALIGRLAQSQEGMAAARDKMEEARDEAEFANQAKSQFLANMSHEIRTPMNGVLGMTELLLNSDQLGANERRFAETVRSSAHSLLAIINDILDISKIEAGKMELDSAPFNPRECIEDTLELLAEGAHRKQLELVSNISSELPGVVVGDETRLRQVMMNLVGNAIKFTKSGQVEVSVAVEETSNNVSRIRFSISDTGIGIAAPHHSGIYRSFSQADSSTSRRFGAPALGWQSPGASSN